MTYTNAYNQAVNNQRAVQQSIITIETKITQIVSAMNNLNVEINKVTGENGQSQSERTVLIQRRTEFTSQLVPYNNQKAGLQATIDNIGAQIRSFQDSLDASKTKCSTISQQVQDSKNNLAALQQRSVNLESIIANLTASLSQKQTIVDDLQRRLNEAIADRDNTKRQLDQAIADRTSLPSQISKAGNDISQYQASYELCTRDTSSIVVKIQTLSDQLKDLNNQINDVNSKIQSIQQQIDSVTIRITSIDASTPDNEGKLADLRNSLQFLKEEYSKTSLERNRLYAAGNDANSAVVMAKQNLEAVIARYKQEQTNIDNANLNLEKARAQ